MANGRYLTMEGRIKEQLKDIPKHKANYLILFDNNGMEVNEVEDEVKAFLDCNSIECHTRIEELEKRVEELEEEVEDLAQELEDYR